MLAVAAWLGQHSGGQDSARGEVHGYAMAMAMAMAMTFPGVLGVRHCGATAVWRV